MNIFLLFQIVFSEFHVESPDYLRDIKLDIQVSLFGNPSFYPIYGKIQTLNGCNFNNTLENESIALLASTSNCCVAEVARRVLKKGGRGLIAVKDSPSLLEMDCEGEEPNILILSLSKKDYITYIKPINTIWITYKYILFQSNYPFIQIKLSGNSSKDLNVIQHLIDLSWKLPIGWDSLKLQLMTSRNNTEADCLVTNRNQVFCMDPESEVPGAVILEFYSSVFHTYEKLQRTYPVKDFLSFLKSVFSNCNYSVSCIEETSKIYAKSVPKGVEILEKYAFLNKGFTGITVNSRDIHWLTYLESAYCLSFLEQPEECGLCSPGCRFSSIRALNCSVFCNNLHCGYSNLACEREKNCYRFMLSDGNCNEMCIDDPDCNQDAEYLRFFIYSLISCCFVVFLAFIVSGIISAIRFRDTALLETQMRSISEIGLKTHRIEDINIKLCPIDLTDILTEEEMVVTPCKHAFHLECLKKILGNSKILKFCPCCKENLKDFKIK